MRNVVLNVWEARNELELNLVANTGAWSDRADACCGGFRRSVSTKEIQMNPTNEHGDVERLRAALKKVARFSHAKDFTHHGVSFEDCDKESCVEARIDLQPTTHGQALSDGWVYEDTLPESITQQQYDWWYERSLVVEGVRMGPSLPEKMP